MTACRMTVALRKGMPAALVALGLVISLSGVAQAATQEAAAVSPATRSVKAVLIHPWDGCAPAADWAELAQNWSQFGTTRLRIDAKTFCSTTKQVTYAALVASRAQVLVFSDTAGAPYQLSSAEISAITQYVQAGHNIVGTYLTFMWGDTNNSALAPLFGLASSFATTAPHVTPDYTITQTESPLFVNVPSPYDSAGYPFSQTPAGGKWNNAALSGAKYAAHTASRVAAITSYANKTDRYRAVYISNMPEYSGNTADEQFLYNALTLGP
jgi:hypothetical protein